jgi:hypothetical protein
MQPPHNRASVDATKVNLAFAKWPTDTQGNVPPHFSVIKAALIPSANDGSTLAVKNDSAGNLIAAQGTGVDGIHRQVIVYGNWPNQQCIFSQDGDPFFHATTYLEHIPESLGTNLFFYTLSNGQVEISYEVIAADTATLQRPDDLRQFAAIRYEPIHKTAVGQILWRPTNMAHGGFRPQTMSFPWVYSVNPETVATGRGILSGKGDYPLDWDITPEANFKDELDKARYFANVFVPNGSGPVIFKLTVKKFLWNMLSWCIGGGFAGLVGGASGGPAGAVAGAVGGCLGGAIGSGLYDIGEMISASGNVPGGSAGGGGGGGATPAPGGQIGDDGGTGFQPPKPKEEQTATE